MKIFTTPTNTEHDTAQKATSVLLRDIMRRTATACLAIVCISAYPSAVEHRRDPIPSAQSITSYSIPGVNPYFMLLRKIHPMPPDPSITGRYDGLVAPLSVLRWWTEIDAASRKHDVNQYLMAAITRIESNGNPRDVSKLRENPALGLTGVRPSSMESWDKKRRLFDPAFNEDRGAARLREYLNQFDNNADLALAAYVAGPNKVVRAGYKVPECAAAYVRVVKKDAAQMELRAGVYDAISELYDTARNPDGQIQTKYIYTQINNMQR